MNFHPLFPCVVRGRWTPPRRYVRAGYPSASVDLRHLGDEERSAEAIRLTQAMVSSYGDHGTVRWLISRYRGDALSPYATVADSTRAGYDNQLDRLASLAGAQRLSGLNHAHIMGWHKHFSDGGRVSNGHHMMTMLRTVISYGVIIENAECGRIDRILSKLRFPTPKPRTIAPTRADVERVIEHADPVMKIGLRIQWDLALRPGDVRAMTWDQIDPGLTRIEGVTSKTGQPFSFDLTLAPVLRDMLIRCERGDGRIAPLTKDRYARLFSQALRASQVPLRFQARDIRAGAITEAEELGADLDARRQFAGHRSSKTTLIYSRGKAEGVSQVMRKRLI